MKYEYLVIGPRSAADLDTELNRLADQNYDLAGFSSAATSNDDHWLSALVRRPKREAADAPIDEEQQALKDAEQVVTDAIRRDGAFMPSQ